MRRPRHQRWSPVRLFIPAWRGLARRSLKRFRADLAEGPERNTAALRSILQRCARSEFGRQHDFAALARSRSLEHDWRSAVPVTDYAGLRDWITRVAAGEADVLFPGLPPLFVSSSGTTDDPKLFPLTRRQQNQALRFIALLTPAVRAGMLGGEDFSMPTSTLMVASRPGQSTPGGIPTGNPSGAGIRRISALAPPFWVFPPAVLGVRDYPAALYLHALFALRAADLACIEAIYSSHVVSWMALIGRESGRLVEDIASGTLDSQLALDHRERRQLQRYLWPDRARARAVAAALDGSPEGLMQRLWPGLKVLSCVITGAFAASLPRLRELAGPGPLFYTTCFGATEGMIGINIDAERPEHYVLALGAGHFEFLPEDELDSARPRALGPEALSPGECYEPVMTTHAGLYRYRTGDVLRCEGMAGRTPVLSFAWRRGNVVDLVGEKTTEAHLSRAIAALAESLPGGAGGITDYALWPDLERVPCRYVVYLEPSGAALARWPGTDTIAHRLDAHLATANPAYRTLGRANGRLDQLQVRVVPAGRFDQLLGQLRERSDGTSANQVKVPRILRQASLRDALEA
ncbi:MAG: GH3 auxin-responsive promoter family protein [Chromatiales bacterium]|nr:GH3 auxin-responsive promoter family protein [Chromatiales bacterium]